MARGVLLLDGQDHFLSVLFKTLPVQDYFLGLMTNTVNPAVSAQIGSGIAEVTGAGYSRVPLIRDTDWTVLNGLAESVIKIFNVGPGGWDDCNGYILCTALTGNNAIMAQAFGPEMQGFYNEAEEIEVAINMRLLDTTETCSP